MTTRAEARAHVMAGGTIEWTDACKSQRRYRNGRHEKRCDWGYGWDSWTEMPSAFMDPETEWGVTAPEAALAVETVRLLPIPQKVKCDTREEAVAHMLAGGVIEYRNALGLRRRKIVGGVEMCWAEYDGSEWLETGLPFMDNGAWLGSLESCRENVLVYETLYLLPVED